MEANKFGNKLYLTGVMLSFGLALAQSGDNGVEMLIAGILELCYWFGVGLQLGTLIMEIIKRLG